MAARRRSFGVQNKTTTIGTSALIALGGINCGRSTPPNPTISSGTTIVDTSASATALPPSPAPPTDDGLQVIEQFIPYVVTLPNIARRTLYTWTTTEQVTALEKDPTLLTRSDSPEFGTSYFEQVLEQRAQKKDPLAKLLRTGAFAKQRYAWVAPYATRIGIGNESYGDELIQVVLKPEAWFVIMKISSARIEVVDIDNKPVAQTEVIAHPERLAAAYFVQDQPVTGYRASLAGPDERVGYREYVIFNESMIESYALGTPEIAGEYKKEIQAIESLLHYLKTHETNEKHWTEWMIDVTAKAWTTPPAPHSVLGTYDATLAFADYPYHPDKPYVELLLEKLRKLDLRSKPFTHKPTVPFQAATTRKPAPAINPRKRNGTF